MNQCTQCSVASSTDSRVFQGPRRWVTSAFGRSVRLELPIDPVQRAGRRVVRHGGANRLATPLALQAQTLHQTFDCAARHRNAFAVQLPPDLVGPIDLEVGLPDPLDLRQQDPIALGAGAAQFGRAPPVGRRGDLQDLADRLDPVRLPVRCWSMQAFTTSVCGRAPLGRKKR